MKIVFSPRYLEYKTPGHPESPERVRGAYDLLKKHGYDFVAPAPCTEKDILRVHTEGLVKLIKKGGFFDLDTPDLTGIFEYAKLAAGGAIGAAHASIREGNEKAFSLMRPPGHHASRDRLEGFCYFNNIAIAIAKFLAKMERVAIIDFDVHFGNGTADIFRGNKKILYVSLHQSPLYPGTGLQSEGNIRNYPLNPGTGEKEYLSIFEKALNEVQEFGPRHIAISAGFDASKHENIAQLKLSEKTFYKIGKKIAGFGIPEFAVLEGGYVNLPENVIEFLNGWSD